MGIIAFILLCLAVYFLWKISKQTKKEVDKNPYGIKETAEDWRKREEKEKKKIKRKPKI